MWMRLSEEGCDRAEASIADRYAQHAALSGRTTAPSPPPDAAPLRGYRLAGGGPWQHLVHRELFESSCDGRAVCILASLIRTACTAATIFITYDITSALVSLAVHPCYGMRLIANETV